MIFQPILAVCQSPCNYFYIKKVSHKNWIPGLGSNMVHWWCPRRNHKNSVKAKKSERPGPTGKEAGKKPQLKKITLREGSDWTMSEVDLLNLEEETAGAAKFFYVGDDVTLNAFPGVVLAFVVLICESRQSQSGSRVWLLIFQSRCRSWAISSPSSPSLLSPPAVDTADLGQTTIMTTTMTRSLKGSVNHISYLTIIYHVFNVPVLWWRRVSLRSISSETPEIQNEDPQ